MIHTAGGSATNFVKRSGYGDFPDNTGDWTIFFRVKHTGAITGETSVLLISETTTVDFNNAYVWVGSDANTSNIQLGVSDNGSSFDSSGTFTLVANTQYWAAITYDTSSSTFSFYIDGSLVGSSFVMDLSAITFQGLAMLGNDSGGADS